MGIIPFFDQIFLEQSGKLIHSDTPGALPSARPRHSGVPVFRYTCKILGDWVKSATNPWLVLCPFWIFFKICAHKKTNNAAPSCAASPPRGKGSIAMPRYYLYRGHTQVQVIRYYGKWGMPERRGRRLAGAPKSGNEIFVSGLSNFWWMLHNHQILFIQEINLV